MSLVISAPQCDIETDITHPLAVTTRPLGSRVPLSKRVLASVRGLGAPSGRTRLVGRLPDMLVMN